MANLQLPCRPTGGSSQRHEPRGNKLYTTLLEVIRFELSTLSAHYIAKGTAPDYF